MLRGALEAAVVLALVSPVALFAVWRTPRRRETFWLAASALFFVVVELASRSGLPPRWDGWNWGGKLLETAVAIAALLLARAARPDFDTGLEPPGRGSWRPALIATGLGLLLPIGGYLLGWREKTTLATFLFQATLPGLAEELQFRGFVQGALDRTFGTPWRVLGADCGYGLVLAQLTWALAHAVGVDRGGHVSIELAWAIPPLVGGWLLGWIRARTGSAWPAVLAHNAGNALLVVLTAVSPRP